MKFDLNNKSNTPIMYNIKLTNVTNTFNPNSDFVYSLRRDGTSITNRVPAPVSDSYIVQKVLIPANTTYNYELDYEFLETGVLQNSNQGKTFSAKIEIEIAK